MKVINHIQYEFDEDSDTEDKDNVKDCIENTPSQNKYGIEEDTSRYDPTLNSE